MPTSSSAGFLLNAKPLHSIWTSTKFCMSLFWHVHHYRRQKWHPKCDWSMISWIAIIVKTMTNGTNRIYIFVINSFNALICPLLWIRHFDQDSIYWDHFYDRKISFLLHPTLRTKKRTHIVPKKPYKFDNPCYKIHQKYCGISFQEMI